MEAIVLTIVTASLGLATWTSQQILNRADERRKSKEELYRKLLDAIIDMSSLADSAPIIVESQRMWLYASDEVLEAVNEYLRYYLNEVTGNFTGTILPDDIRSQIQERDAYIRLAIRRDIRPMTRIGKSWIHSRYIAVAAPSESIVAYRKGR
jgi:hypothetical protein